MISNGGIGVLATDTIYGLVGSALSKKAVAKIYKLRQRNTKKPMIILIGAIKDLFLFGIKLDGKTKKLLNKFWPGKISVILPCLHKKFFYLHRGTKTLAFRLPAVVSASVKATADKKALADKSAGKPAKKNLIKLLKLTGPLVAPSANPEGLPPAKTIKQAQKYFGNKIDFYVDEGKLSSKPSTLAAIKNGQIIIKRKGAVKI